MVLHYLAHTVRFRHLKDCTKSPVYHCRGTFALSESTVGKFGKVHFSLNYISLYGYMSRKFIHNALTSWKTRPTTQHTWKIRPKIFLPIFLQNNVQCKSFVAAVISRLISLPWMRWQSQTDITGDQPITLIIKRVNLKYYEIYYEIYI